jgi:hypothetical protein
MAAMKKPLKKWSVVQARKRFPNQADCEALSQFRCPIRFFKRVAPEINRSIRQPPDDNYFDSRGSRLNVG